MPLERVLEPEVMDSPEEASDYDAMDHREVNRRFVEDLLERVRERVQGSGFRVQDGGRGRVQSSGFGVQGGGGGSEHSVPSTQYSVPSTQYAAPGAASTAPDAVASLPEPRTLNPEPSFLDILDLGTGTAQIPIELCKRYPDCRVMAVDAAVNMLELARYNVEIASLTRRIELAHVDAKKLPFTSGLFDVVMSNSIVHHIPEPTFVLREAVRVAKPGGLLYFRDLLRPESKKQLDQLVQTYAGDANEHQQRMFAESLHAALSLDEIREFVGSLGFALETVQQTSDRHWTWSAHS